MDSKKTVDTDQEAYYALEDAIIKSTMKGIYEGRCSDWEDKETVANLVLASKTILKWYMTYDEAEAYFSNDPWKPL